MGYGSGESLPARVVPLFGEPQAEYRERILATAQGTLKRLLSLESMVLCCFCRDASLCHRTTLALVLSSLGATFAGEKTLPLLPVRCMIRSCGSAITETQGLCPDHWHMVPFDVQRALVASYSPQQRHDGLFSRPWFAAMGLALRAIAEATETPEPPTEEWSNAWGGIVPLTREGRERLWPDPDAIEEASRDPYSHQYMPGASLWITTALPTRKAPPKPAPKGPPAPPPRPRARSRR